jgi:general secretion pathway protein A
MSTPEKFSTYLVLIGLQGENALIINAQQQKVVVPLSKIGRDWTGETVYLWKRPPGFSETLLLSDTSPTVAWVAQQFAKLDKQKEPLSDDLFNIALHERLKIFQRTKGINADGNINEQTLLKINEVVGADQTLITEFNTAILNDAEPKATESKVTESKTTKSKEAMNHVPTP